MLGEKNLPTIFRKRGDYIVNTAVNENHVFGLIKLDTKIYCKIRLYHSGKECTELLTGERVTKKFNKFRFMLFKNQ